LGVRTCVIFNPAAKGDKARHFRRHLDEFASRCTFKLTAGPDDARRLATEAVGEGAQVVVAAGGDGTVNEVLNGIGDAPKGFEQACLGVLPLGTVNVFARELSLPMKLEAAWQTVLSGRETRIDLPSVDHNGGVSRYFVQLAGAGLDARAVELVDWSLKKKVGPLAYVYAGLKALLQSPSTIIVTGGNRTLTGQLVLIGNGRLYGGNYQLFPEADLSDGLLEVCVFPKVNWFTLLRCGPELLLRQKVPASQVLALRADSVTLQSSDDTPFEVDGELAGRLPATFRVRRQALRVIVPSSP
jgi:YegS/Rv2252/BmrU family lipid kinase